MGKVAGDLFFSQLSINTLSTTGRTGPHSALSALTQTWLSPSVFCYLCSNLLISHSLAPGSCKSWKHTLFNIWNTAVWGHAVKIDAHIFNSRQKDHFSILKVKQAQDSILHARQCSRPAPWKYRWAFMSFSTMPVVVPDVQKLPLLSPCSMQQMLQWNSTRGSLEQTGTTDELGS